MNEITLTEEEIKWIFSDAEILSLYTNGVAFMVFVGKKLPKTAKEVVDYMKYIKSCYEEED